MTTFREFSQIVKLAAENGDSRKRMKEIRKILQKHKALRNPTPESAVAALQELGPTFVKIGQIASNRGDMLDPEYCKAFESLRSNVTPMTFEEIQKRLDESYGHPWQEYFSELDDEPLGSASIAQVHRAVLKNGDVVAVKVRRPGIVATMYEDIVLMRKVLAISEFLTPANQLLKSAGAMVDELERTTRDELNFEVELNNLLRFSEDVKDVDCVNSPHAYPEYSTAEVLVMEYVDGISIGNKEALVKEKYDLHKLGETLADNYITQVLDNGFFHADPHPGNAIVRGDEIVWIDLGMTGTLDFTQRALIGRMFLAIASGDSYALKESLLSLTEVDKNLDHGKLLSDVECMTVKYGATTTGDLDVGQALLDSIELLHTYNIALPAALTMLGRGFVTVEGAVRALTSNVSFVAILTQHAQDQLTGAEAIKAKAKEMLAASISAAEASTRLPRQAANTLDMLQKGQSRMNMNLQLSKETLSATYTMVGNICLSLIAAALFIGSSMLCTTDMAGPELLQVPALGVAGFFGAFVLSVYVIVRTIKIRHQIKNDLKIK